jgi:NTE family protein
MPSLAEQLQDKKVALSLAAGYFGFYHHAGVIMALEELGIKPVRVSGTSAGALVGSMYAAGMDAQEMSDVLLALNREDFWDLTWPLGRYGFGLLGGHRFRAELARVLPVHLFEDCRIPLFVAIYALAQGRVKYLSSGPLVSAVYASCAVPYLFAPAVIQGERYWDGGFGEKVPLIPFLNAPEVDTVLISYLPMRGSRANVKKSGIRALLPTLSALFADTPEAERHERDLASVGLLRESGREVKVLAPKRIALGPFSLERAAEALEQGRVGTLRILESEKSEFLGSPELS